MKFNSDFVVIDKLPEPSDVVSINVRHSFPGSLFKELEFYNWLRNAKPLQPNDEKLLQWNYVPWYSVELVTASGNYEFNLYRGGLGIVTVPNGSKGAIMFSLK